jgi:hypothetical protein
MTREEAIKWIDDRMCFGRGTFTEHHPPNIDECWQAGMMAIEALSAEPKTEHVLCALADRVCPFQGKEYAWCLTCPHISEEDRALLKRAVAPVESREQPEQEKWSVKRE